MTHAIVIGAGVVGTSVAFRLAQAGTRVTILETGYVGGGTSGASFAWINANNKPPRAYHDLNVAGMHAHVALADEFGRAPWWHRSGNIEWYLDDAKRAAQREKIERLRAWGYDVEWLTAAQLRDLEPDIDPAAVGGAPVAFYPSEGWVDPVVYAHAMVDAAVRHGAVLRTGVNVDRLQIAGARVTGVHCAGGERLGADVVVNCAGHWANHVVDPDMRIPESPTRGFLVFTAPAPTCLRAILHAPQCHVRPDGGGRLMLHIEETDRTTTGTTLPETLPAARDVVRHAAMVLPGIRGIEPEAVRVGTRPIPADSYPAIGPVKGIGGYYLAVSHSAVTLAPFLGRAVAAEVAHDRSEPLLAPYRPDRFAAARGTATTA